MNPQQREILQLLAVLGLLILFLSGWGAKLVKAANTSATFKQNLVPPQLGTGNGKP